MAAIRQALEDVEKGSMRMRALVAEIQAAYPS